MGIESTKEGKRRGKEKMKAKEGVNTMWANLVVCSVQQGRNARWRERG